MINTNDFKRGTRIEIDGEPYAISDMSTQTTGGRGGIIRESATGTFPITLR